jgi:hypothetical protein
LIVLEGLPSRASPGRCPARPSRNKLPLFLKGNPATRNYVTRLILSPSHSGIILQAKPNRFGTTRKDPGLTTKNPIVMRRPNALQREPSDQGPHAAKRGKASRHRASKESLGPIGGNPFVVSLSAC